MGAHCWSRGNLTIAIERISRIICCMEGKPYTGGGYLHLGILGTVERLYTKCWRRRCLLNHKGYRVATYRLTLAYYLYIVIESTGSSERRYIVRCICPYMGTAYIGSSSGLVPLILERTTSFGYHAERPNCFILAISCSCRRCCDSGLLIDSYPYRNGTFLITTVVLNHTVVIGNTCRGSVWGISISHNPCGGTSMYDRGGIFEPLIGQSLSGSHHLEGVKNGLSFTIGSVGRLLGNGEAFLHRYRNDITFLCITSCIVSYFYKVIGSTYQICRRGIGSRISTQYRGGSHFTISAILIPLVGIVCIITLCHYGKWCYSSSFTIRGSWDYRLSLDL